MQLTARSFEVGSIYVTPGALELLRKAGHCATPLLKRHAAADFGDVPPEDWRANVAAIADGSRIISSYKVAGETVWVITEGEDDAGVRQATTILLPAEY